jgi:hypothetical protein
LLTSFEQACNGCLLEELIDASRYLLPPMMHGAGVRIAAGCAADETAASSCGLERRDNARECESFGRCREAESSFWSALGSEHARSREEVKRFRQVVAGTAHDSRDVVDADGCISVRLRDAENSVKGLLGGARQPHQPARKK